MRIVSRPAATSAVLALCFAGLGRAQSAPSPSVHNLVVLVHVKSDMLNEWIDLQKNEIIPAQKKVGVPTRTTYETLYGNTNEYLIVTPFEKYADLDAPNQLVRALGAEDSARLTAKLQKCLESRQVFFSDLMPEQTYAPGGGLPALGVFTRVRVAFGRLPDYQDFLKNDVLPLYKKVNQGYTVSRRGLGGNTNDITAISWLNKMADIDGGGPITRVLGTAGATKLLAKSAGMTTLIEQVVRRKVPGLSY